MTLPVIVESGLNEAGTAVAVIVHPERGSAAILEYVNEPFSAVMRKSTRELTGAAFASILALVGKPESREMLLRSLQTGTPIELDVLLTPGAAERWFGFRLSYPTAGVSGVRNAILIGRDITAARKNASQDDKMRQLLAQIFMRINAPVTIVSQTGEMIMCNASFRQLTGYSADELRRMRKEDLTPPNLLEATMKARDRQFADGERYEMDVETLAKGGHRIPVRLTSVLLSDNDQSYRVVTMIPRTVAVSQLAPADTAAAQAYATQDRGELRAISLDALRSICGADWERIASRAMLKAEQVIRRRLERDDVMSRSNDTDFVVWFSSVDHDRNSAMLQTIVRDVRLSFLTEFGEQISSFVSATLVPAATPQEKPEAPPLAPKHRGKTIHYTNTRATSAAR